MASKNELVQDIERIDTLISGLIDQRRMELEELEAIEALETH